MKKLRKPPPTLSLEPSATLQTGKRLRYVLGVEGKGAFTLFAPTDSAFGKSPEDLRKTPLDDQNRLAAVLRHHNRRWQVNEQGLIGLEPSHFAGGRHSHGQLYVDEALLSEVEAGFDNGARYKLAKVIVPKEFLYRVPLKGKGLPTFTTR